MYAQHSSILSGFQIRHIFPLLVSWIINEFEKFTLLRCWTFGFLVLGLFQYGVQLRHNHDDMLRKLKKLTHLDGSSRKMQVCW